MKLLNNRKQFDQVLQLFDEYTKNNMETPSNTIITQTLKACVQMKDLQRGSAIHHLISPSAKNDPYILASLIHLYAQCGDVLRAQSLFDTSSRKTPAMYGAIMTGYVTNNQAQKAIDLFHEIESPNEVLITILYNACAREGTSEALNVVKKVSSRMPKSLYSDARLSASLVDALMKCGDVTHAQSLFDTSSNKSLQMYGAMMEGYVTNNQAQKAIDLFHEIESPNEVLITILYNACAREGTSEALNVVKKVSSRMPKSLYSDARLSTSLVDALMKCGDVTHAQSLFDVLSKKPLQMYGAMMKGYVINNQAQKAIDLFGEIKSPDEVLITILFNACAQEGTSEALNVVKKVSSRIPKSFYSNPRLSTSLVDALMKCGDVTHAQSLFDTSSNKSLQMYGAMMEGYVTNNQAQKAIDLFNEIKSSDEVLITILFNACAQEGTSEALNVVKKVSSRIPKSFYSNPRLSTSLVDALMKCGDVTHAQSLFDTSSNKSLQMYGAMMKGYVTNNQAQKAIDLFHEIKNPDEILVMILFNACAQLATIEALNLAKEVSSEIPQSFYSHPRLSASLLDAFIKCGDCSSAEIIFPRTERSAINYGNLMSGFNKENSPEKTLKLFEQMQVDGIEANSIVYLCIIKALSQIGDYSLCESVVQDIPDSVVVDGQVHNALIDMWGKVGSIDHAKEVFERSSQPDEYGYTAMINSYGLNGMGSEAVELFHQMPAKLVDEASCVCVLNACSHSGLVDQARSIMAKFPVKTEKIYTTMIDCLSRASMFEEAQVLIDKYECNNPASQPMYMALLSGARNANNSQLSQVVFDRMKSRFSQSPSSLTSAYVLLANVYGSSGQLDKASNIRVQLDKSGLKKTVGVSRIVIQGKVFEFRAHDRSHPLTSQIYTEGEKISKQLLAHGHRFDSSWITRSLNREETVESVLCGHSERLAIAFAFVVDPAATRIQITKNLRVCGDCHRVTKLIAQIRQCEIIVRDANRIHHFQKNGQCSCNDYF